MACLLEMIAQEEYEKKNFKAYISNIIRFATIMTVLRFPQYLKSRRDLRFVFVGTYIKTERMQS